MDGETTTLTKASTRSESLRTTVPAGIVRQFKLKEGDMLDWELKAEKSKLIVIVRPISRRKKGDAVRI